jgi:polysaccharide biosynthesis/export protein
MTIDLDARTFAPTYVVTRIRKPRILPVAGLTLVVVTYALPLAAQTVPTERTPDGASTEMPVTLPDDPEVLEAVQRERAPDEAPSAPLPLEKPVDPGDYHCGPGDVFELNFWGRQNFRLQVVADLEGRIFISKVGLVKVAGLSLTQVRARVTRKVRRNYPGLKFDLVLARPRTFVVHVVDNVKKPGVYLARPTDRVSSVLERAGGITGSKRRIRIRRAGGQTVNADLLLYELTGDTKHNPMVLDGDVVEIPFSGVVVSISGPVQRPGEYELVDTQDLTELLALAGGFRSSVARNLPVRLTRRNARQQASFSYIRFDANGDLPNHKLRDEDAVAVRGTNELQRTIQLIGAIAGADPLDPATGSKRLTYVEGDTVRTLIDRAGGITAPGDLSRAYISRPRMGKAPELIPLDLDALLIRRDFSADKPIRLGDELVVPTARRGVLVEGAVQRPGTYGFNPQFGIAEYLAHAGGRTRTAQDLDNVKLIKPTGATYPYRADTRLQPGDAILVPERNFSRAEVVQILIAGGSLLLGVVTIGLAASR